MFLIVMKLVNTRFYGLFSDPHCRYLRPMCVSDCDETGEHEVLWGVLISSL